VKDQSTFITVILAASYFHANDIREADLLTKPDMKWTIKGAILIGVESIHERASSKMLSLFAGEE
jgi:hypothetical protein